MVKQAGFSKAVRHWCALASLLGALVGAHGAAGAASPAPLAKMGNGEVVTESDFQAYLARRIDLKPVARNYWGAEKALKEMLTTRVLVLEGIRMKEPFRTGSEPERFDDPYALSVYRRLAKTCPKADAATARKFFDEHPEAFTAPPSVRLARVMLPVTQQIEGAPAMAWLMDRAMEVAKQTVGFDKVAARAAAVYKLEPQGDLGWANFDGDAAIMRALAAAKSGEMVGPMKDGDFAYLFLLGDKREARVFKWPEVEASAANRQMVYCREQASKVVTDKLYKQYGVVVNEAAVRALFDPPAAARTAPASSGGAK